MGGRGKNSASSTSRRSSERLKAISKSSVTMEKINEEAGYSSTSSSNARGEESFNSSQEHEQAFNAIQAKQAAFFEYDEGLDMSDDELDIEDYSEIRSAQNLDRFLKGSRLADMQDSIRAMGLDPNAPWLGIPSTQTSPKSPEKSDGAKATSTVHASMHGTIGTTSLPLVTSSSSTAREEQNDPMQQRSSPIPVNSAEQMVGPHMNIDQLDAQSTGITFDKDGKNSSVHFGLNQEKLIAVQDDNCSGGSRGEQMESQNSSLIKKADPHANLDKLNADRKLVSGGVIQKEQKSSTSGDPHVGPQTTFGINAVSHGEDLVENDTHLSSGKHPTPPPCEDNDNVHLIQNSDSLHSNAMNNQTILDASYVNPANHVASDGISNANSSFEKLEGPRHHTFQPISNHADPLPHGLTHPFSDFSEHGIIESPTHVDPRHAKDSNSATARINDTNQPFSLIAPLTSNLADALSIGVKDNSSSAAPLPTTAHGGYHNAVGDYAGKNQVADINLPNQTTLDQVSHHHEGLGNQVKNSDLHLHNAWATPRFPLEHPANTDQFQDNIHANTSFFDQFPSVQQANNLGVKNSATLGHQPIHHTPNFVTNNWQKHFLGELNVSLKLNFFGNFKNKDGRTIAVPPESVFHAGAQHWNSCLIGQFIGKPPPFFLIRRMVDTQWKKFGHVEIQSNESGLFVFRFESQEFCDSVMQELWHVHHHPLLLRRWEIGLQLIKLNCERVPIWLKLRNVPLDLLNNDGLSFVSSTIGLPLQMDSKTASRSHLGYARVCVEMNILKDLPDRTYVELPNGEEAEILIEYDWKPQKCTFCNVAGHDTSNCPNSPDNRVEDKPSGTNSEWNEADKKHRRRRGASRQKEHLVSNNRFNILNSDEAHGDHGDQIDERSQENFSKSKTVENKTAGTGVFHKKTNVQKVNITTQAHVQQHTSHISVTPYPSQGSKDKVSTHTFGKAMSTNRVVGNSSNTASTSKVTPSFDYTRAVQGKFNGRPPDRRTH